MIRDTRRINIETNFFDDDNDIDFKPQQDTFESMLHVKEKGAIALFNVIDTIRLHRIINSFACISSIPSIRIRKYSSKVVFLKDLSVQKKSLIIQGTQQDKSVRENANEEQFELRPLRNVHQPKFLNKKRSESASAVLNKEGQYLRQSRKRILQGINKTLDQKPQSRSQQVSRERSKATSKAKINLKINETGLQQQKIHPIANKQTEQIKRRLHKLQNLMKNIRRQKETKQPVRIHQKKQVSHLPKRQKNHESMRVFIEQIHLLRRQVAQIKQLNQSILNHSREKSRSSSAAAKSQQFQSGNFGKERLLGVKNIKRSQVINDKKYGKSTVDNKSENSYNFHLKLDKIKKKEVKQEQNFSPRQRILSHAKGSKQRNTSNEKNKNRSQKKANKSQIIRIQQTLLQEKEKLKQHQLNKQKLKQKYKIQPRGSNRQRLKRQPSITESEDQLNNDNEIILTNQNIEGSPKPKQNFKKAKQAQKKQQTKQQTAINNQQTLKLPQKPTKPTVSHKKQLIQLNKQFTNVLQDNNNYTQMAQATKQKQIQIEMDTNIINSNSNINITRNRSNEKEYKDKPWYKQYGEPRYNFSSQQKNTYNRQDNPYMKQDVNYTAYKISKIDDEFQNDLRMYNISMENNKIGLATNNNNNNNHNTNINNTTTNNNNYNSNSNFNSNNSYNYNYNADNANNYNVNISKVNNYDNYNNYPLTNNNINTNNSINNSNINSVNVNSNNNNNSVNINNANKSLQNMFNIDNLTANDAVSDFASRNTSSMNSPNGNPSTKNSYQFPYNNINTNDDEDINIKGTTYKSYNQYDNKYDNNYDNKYDINVQYHGYASSYLPNSNYLSTTTTNNNNNNNSINNNVSYQAKYNNNTSYSGSSRSKQKSYRTQQDGYTNPQLLKQLNLGTYPKINSNYTTTSNNNNNYNVTSYTSNNNTDKYSIDIDNNSRYRNSNNSNTSNNNNSSNNNNNNNNNSNSNAKGNIKIDSSHTISDNDSYNSYTYSKGSSAITSMNKIQQQYNNIINTNNQDTKNNININTTTNNNNNVNYGNNSNNNSNLNSSQQVNYASYQPNSTYQSVQQMPNYLTQYSSSVQHNKNYNTSLLNNQQNSNINNYNYINYDNEGYQYQYKPSKNIHYIEDYSNGNYNINNNNGYQTVFTNYANQK